MFNHAAPQETELAAIRALARVCQVSLADLNRRAYQVAPERLRSCQVIDQHIAANRRAYRASLDWEINHSKG